MHTDNQSVAFIDSSFVSCSPAMMDRELRRLNLVPDALGIRIRAKPLPSVANKFADSLSRRFPRGDIQIRLQVRHSVLDGLEAPMDAFPLHPLGEHPVYRRRQAFENLGAPWEPDQVRLLCPPVDLNSPTVAKLHATKVPAILMTPDWPQQPWH